MRLGREKIHYHVFIHFFWMQFQFNANNGYQTDTKNEMATICYSESRKLVLSIGIPYKLGYQNQYNRKTKYPFN